MKHIFITFLATAFLLCACDPSSEEDSQSDAKFRAEQAKLLADAEKLHAILSESDTINIEAIQKCIDEGVDLNYPVPFNYKVENIRVKSGSILSFLNSSTITRSNVDALQITLISQKPGYEEASLYLLEQGADPNHQSQDSMVCLDWINMLELDGYWRDTLIANGANPALVNLDLLGTDLDLIDFYMKRGANPKTINLNHFFDWVYAQKCKFSRKGNWMDNIKTVLAYDPNVQAIEPKNIVSGHWRNEKPIVELLVDKGLDFNQPVDYVFKKTKMKEKYWLDFAFQKRNVDLLRYLLSNGITKTNFKFDSTYLANTKYDPELKQLIKDKLLK
ncbi:MAG: hypothetical protein P8P74_02350 [Crocinitomicaceae bacterium]|nr:hypothetical protein [Crocinitomicaceae bacterium]